MKIIYWNIRVVKKFQAVGGIRFIKKKGNSDVMIIAEIFINEENYWKIRF